MNVWMDTCVYLCSGALFIGYDMYGDQTTMWKTYFSLSALWIPRISYLQAWHQVPVLTVPSH